MIVQGWLELSYMTQPFYLKVLINGEEMGRRRLEESGEFVLRFGLTFQVLAGRVQCVGSGHCMIYAAQISAQRITTDSTGAWTFIKYVNLYNIA